MTTREKSIEDAELHLSWAMAAASAQEMNKHIGDDGGEFDRVEDLFWEAETLLLQAFGETPVSSALVSRFVRQVVPFFLPEPLRARQLAMLEKGELTTAIVSLGSLVEMPLEYALPLLETTVQPFAELRTA